MWSLLQYLKVHSRPKQSATALAVPTSDAAVLALLLALESELGDFAAALKGVSGNAISCVVAHVPSARNPFGAGKVPDFAVLIEWKQRRISRRVASICSSC